MKIYLTILISTLILFTSCETAQQEQPIPLPSLEGKKALIVWGGWDGHKPKEYAERMQKWLESEGVTVTVSDSLGIYKDSTFMASLDVILPYWTMGKISKEEEKGLLDAVKNGVGIAGCHGGFGDSFRNNVDYQYMVGGQWVQHPGGEIDYSVQITNPNDAVTNGVNDFTIKTEQYYMHTDPNVKVLATTTFNADHDEWINGSVMPLAWKKYHNKGRVFFLSIGHSPSTFEVPEVWTMLTRGVKWASGSKHLEKEEWIQPIYMTKK